MARFFSLSSNRWHHWLQLDPRWYQLAVLLSIILVGTLWQRLEIDACTVITILITITLSQWLLSKIVALPSFDPRSAWISGLSLIILLRSSSCMNTAIIAGVAVLSKFIFRYQKKHLFNPSNFALIFALLSGLGWVSPGQWGNDLFLLFFFAFAANFTLWRSARWDISLAFLFFYTTLLFLRALWLGDPWTIPWHQLQSGSLLLFSFLMISDPKATPDARIARIVFALAVALVAIFLRFILYIPHDPLWALILCSLLTPLLDHLWPHQRFTW
ncbi:RnfABCDGE type electron transport complex subunit D [Magnetococcales bacterium HHB-1]